MAHSWRSCSTCGIIRPASSIDAMDIAENPRRQRSMPCLSCQVARNSDLSLATSTDEGHSLAQALQLRAQRSKTSFTAGLPRSSGSDSADGGAQAHWRVHAWNAPHRAWLDRRGTWCRRPPCDRHPHRCTSQSPRQSHYPPSNPSACRTSNHLVVRRIAHATRRCPSAGASTILPGFIALFGIEGTLDLTEKHPSAPVQTDTR